MRTDRPSNQWHSDTIRVSAAIAVAIHVVIIAALIATQRTANYTAGYDSIEGSSTGTAFGGTPVKSNWHLLILAVVNNESVPLDSVLIHEMLGDSVKVTSRSGRTEFAVRAGAMFLARITRRGYEPLTLRLPNTVAKTSTHTVRMAPTPPH